MIDVLKSMFAFIGVVFVGSVLIAFILIILNKAAEVILKMKVRYMNKHRFEKPPVAKCYCRDCKRWNPKTGECSDSCNSRLMNPAWFCWFAEPIGNDGFKEREEIIKDIEKSQN